MLEHLYKDYGLRLQPVTIYGQQWLSDERRLFGIQLMNMFHHTELSELSLFCSHLVKQGDDRVATIVPTKDGRYFTSFEERSYVLLAFPESKGEKTPDGEALAEFHREGQKALQGLNKPSQFLKWPDFWAKRIDDIAIYWHELESKNEHSEYEELFLKVFPYFSGRAENAIQYMTDLIIDESITDESVLCHHRFNEKCWGQKSLFVKTPDQWVIDHPARDIAEWVRFAVLNSHRSLSNITEFIDTYQSEQPLSNAGLGMVFARLLFPIEFIENVESVIDRPDDPRQELIILKELLYKTDDEERLMASLGKRYLRSLPRVDWLAKKLKTSI